VETTTGTTVVVAVANPIWVGTTTTFLDIILRHRRHGRPRRAERTPLRW